MDLFSHVFHMFFSYLITEMLILESLYCKKFFEIINKRGDLNKHWGIGKKSKINERGCGKGGGEKGVGAFFAPKSTHFFSFVSSPVFLCI